MSQLPDAPLKVYLEPKNDAPRIEGPPITPAQRIIGMAIEAPVVSPPTYRSR